ncbi:hypothetical protein HYDPIDRAFT_114274 [Hydnomerulius pinastri MD-312]|uniref:Uncharacterized protein n=1 Tax=Hydnomerulius pinastri MD-312 TaxID=994086 RepID=A0A0C9WD12_9AGAM|nr:hypothetical protein HYDPIDRAFT_114274 [Hydnomerulius pinastri MD-312]
MGRSAKVHKRTKKTTTPSHAQRKPAAPEPKSKSGIASADASSSVQSAKRRADLKAKVKAKPGAKTADGEHVLGGADYVTLLMGGRRRAAEEALKLPREE